MKILVCGGRDYKDRQHVFTELDRLCRERGWMTEEDEDGNWLPRVTVISGKARGVDTFAADWGTVNWCEVHEFPADWEKHGKAAGYIRNQEMLDQDPDVVVAFPGGRGTFMMKKIARKKGTEVIEIE